MKSKKPQGCIEPTRDETPLLPMPLRKIVKQAKKLEMSVVGFMSSCIFVHNFYRKEVTLSGVYEFVLGRFRV